MWIWPFLRGALRIAAAMPSERPASALQSGGLPFDLGYMHVNGPAGCAAQKATQVILLCRHGGEKQTSSNRRDRLYTLLREFVLPQTKLHNDQNRPNKRISGKKISSAFVSHTIILLETTLRKHWPTTAQRCRSETEKNILEDLLSSVLSNSKKYHPSGNLKFDNLGIFQSLKLRFLMEKFLPISLKLNFTPNTLGCYG